MIRNVHLYHMQGREWELISMGLIGYRVGETLLSLHNKLENTQYFTSSFQFWDSRLSSPIHIKLEGLIFIQDLEGKVVVFETKDLNDVVQHVPGNVLALSAVLHTNREVGVVCEYPVDHNEPEKVVVNFSVASSELSVVGEDSLDGKALFLSKKMSAAAETTWKDQVEKLIKLQQKVQKGDHAWKLKTWDEGEIAFGMFEGELREALAARDRYKKLLEKELETAGEVNLVQDRLNDEISSLKFSLERAERNQTLARQELAAA